MKEYKLRSMEIKSYQNHDGTKFFISVTDTKYKYKARYEFTSKKDANEWFKMALGQFKDLKVKKK